MQKWENTTSAKVRYLGNSPYRSGNLADLDRGRAQELADLAARNGRAEQIALGFLDPLLRRDERKLLLGFDSLDHHGDAKFGGKRRDAVQSRDGPGARAQTIEERAVDLDLLQRKAVEIAQARIAGSEIVERDADAKLAQLIQRSARE